MDENLIIGIELLDYTSELTDVAEQLIIAYQTMQEIYKCLNEQETYEGEAKISMTNFVISLTAHIERLCLLYKKAAEYSYNTYETMYQSDAAMAALLLKQMNREQVVVE